MGIKRKIRKTISIVLVLSIILSNQAAIYAESWERDEENSYTTENGNESITHIEGTKETSSGMGSVIQRKITEITTRVTGNQDPNATNAENVAQETSTSYDIEQENGGSWEGFYKNFIREIGAIRFTFYDTNGNHVTERIIAPKQFQGSEYEFTPSLIMGTNNIIIRDSKSPFKLNLQGILFSDNIPFMVYHTHETVLKINNKNTDEISNKFIESESGDDEDSTTSNMKSMIDLTKWNNPKNTSDWLNEKDEQGNELVNLKNLDNEIKFGLKNKEGKEVNVIEWLGEIDETTKTTPSIKIEPISFYPDSTEEIMCDSLEVSEKYNLTYDTAMARATDELGKIYTEDTRFATIEHEDGETFGEAFDKFKSNTISNAKNVGLGIAEFFEGLLTGEKTIGNKAVNANAATRTAQLLNTNNVYIHIGIQTIDVSANEYSRMNDYVEQIEKGVGTAAVFAATGAGALAGAAKGAVAGAIAGPAGAAIGALVGLGVGFIVGKLISKPVSMVVDAANEAFNEQHRTNKEFMENLDPDAGYKDQHVSGIDFRRYAQYFNRKFIRLSYTETTKYVREWQKGKGNANISAKDAWNTIKNINDVSKTIGFKGIATSIKIIDAGKHSFAIPIGSLIPPISSSDFDRTAEEMGIKKQTKTEEEIAIDELPMSEGEFSKLADNYSAYIEEYQIYNIPEENLNFMKELFQKIFIRIKYCN